MVIFISFLIEGFPAFTAVQSVSAGSVVQHCRAAASKARDSDRMMHSVTCHVSQ